MFQVQLWWRAKIDTTIEIEICFFRTRVLVTKIFSHTRKTMKDDVEIESLFPNECCPQSNVYIFFTVSLHHILLIHLNCRTSSFPVNGVDPFPPAILMPRPLLLRWIVYSIWKKRHVKIRWIVLGGHEITNSNRSPSTWKLIAHRLHDRDHHDDYSVARQGQLCTQSDLLDYFGDCHKLLFL